MRRLALSWGWLACVLAGCWSDEARVDGFTDEQWKSLQKDFTPQSLDLGCRSVRPTASCADAVDLGQRLFYDPALSGTGTISCATCHNPTGWYIDTRANSAVSMGALKPTKHNTISVVNLAYKQTYTWTGECGSSMAPRPCALAETVITDIALPKAMASSADHVASYMTTDAVYSQLYRTVYGEPSFDVNETTAMVAAALTTYMDRLISLDAPFDHYIEGNASALGDSARRGFTLFVGKAMCVECHSGPMFSDGALHVTGLQQRGTPDGGAAGTGAFFTPPLRQLDKTGPYMHDGSLTSLGEVIDFYRRGGDATGFVGEKDPLMQPLDITDDEARDLEAFLRSLTGQPISPELTADLRPPPPSPSGGPTCTTPMTMCGTACVDTDNDAMNCGSCGNVCPTNKPTCVAGTCVH